MRAAAQSYLLEACCRQMAWAASCQQTSCSLLCSACHFINLCPPACTQHTTVCQGCFHSKVTAWHCSIMQEEALDVTGQLGAQEAAQWVLDRPKSCTQWYIVKQGSSGSVLCSRQAPAVYNQPALEVNLPFCKENSELHVSISCCLRVLQPCCCNWHDRLLQTVRTAYLTHTVCCLIAQQKRGMCVWGGSCICPIDPCH